MINDVGGFLDFRQGFDPDFVIGLILADKTKAFYYRDVAAVEVINDDIGGIPILVWSADNNFHAYVRQAGDQVLTFRSNGGRIVDDETGSTWDISRGLAIDGPLKGEGLQAVPGSTSYDWAWLDFYPDTAFYRS